MKLELPESLEFKRAEFLAMVGEAEERIRMFAEEHNWHAHVAEPLVKTVKILSSKDSFDEAVLEAFNLDKNYIIPRTAVAVVAGDELLMVPPNIYLELYPQGYEKDFFIKLKVHELAHVLHIRILGGNEDKMGPKWFYEGFAVYAAEQFTEYKIQLSMDEICTIISSDKDVSYQAYKEVIVRVLEKADLATLVEQAGETDFSVKINRLLVE